MQYQLHQTTNPMSCQIQCKPASHQSQSASTCTSTYIKTYDKLNQLQQITNPMKQVLPSRTCIKPCIMHQIPSFNPIAPSQTIPHLNPSCSSQPTHITLCKTNCSKNTKQAKQNNPCRKSDHNNMPCFKYIQLTTK